MKKVRRRQRARSCLSAQYSRADIAFAAQLNHSCIVEFKGFGTFHDKQGRKVVFVVCELSLDVAFFASPPPSGTCPPICCPAFP